MTAAKFGSTDPHPQFATADPSEEKYLGPERRVANRRDTVDRRDEVRFELKSSDRRQVPGRRGDDAIAATFW
ncbi:MAG: hypothetical protein V7746_14450 [Halioglobus sp.]